MQQSDKKPKSRSNSESSLGIAVDNKFTQEKGGGPNPTKKMARVSKSLDKLDSETLSDLTTVMQQIDNGDVEFISGEDIREFYEGLLKDITDRKRARVEAKRVFTATLGA